MVEKTGSNVFRHSNIPSLVLVVLKVLLPVVTCVLIEDDPTDVTELFMEQTNLIDVTDGVLLWRPWRMQFQVLGETGSNPLVYS